MVPLLGAEGHCLSLPLTPAGIPWMQAGTAPPGHLGAPRGGTWGYPTPRAVVGHTSLGQMGVPKDR